MIEIYLITYDLPAFRAYFTSRSEENQKSKVIAQLMSRKNSIKFQEINTLIWEETSENQALYAQELILSLEKSKAEIAFLDGSGIVLDENSLIKLERNTNTAQSQQLVIQLLRGTIHKSNHLRVQKGLEKRPYEMNGNLPIYLSIQVEDMTIPLPPETELTVTATTEHVSGRSPSSVSSPETHIVVQNGELHVQTAQGEVSLNRGEEVTLSKRNLSQIPTRGHLSPFILQSPTGGETIEAESDTSIKFSWEVNLQETGGSPLQLEVSTDPEFKNPSEIHQLKISATEPPMRSIEARLTLPLSVQPNAWFWRIQTLEEHSQREVQTSSVGKFWVQHKNIPIPSLLLPDLGVNVKGLPPPPTQLFEPEIQFQESKEGAASE